MGIVLTSGHVNAAASAGNLCDGGPLVSKPHDPQLVVDRINRLIGEGECGRQVGAA